MRHPKLLLFLAPGLFFFGVCGWNVWGSYRKILQTQEAEAAVTVPVAQFTESYRPGQRWVQFEGRLAIDQHRQEQLRTRTREPIVGIVAPLVPPGWAPADPVHVLVHCATVEPEKVQAMLADLKARPLSVVSNEPTTRKIDEVRAEFPNLNFAEPLILVVGISSEPFKPDVTSAVVWFFVLLTAFFAWFTYLVRQVRREFARIDQEGDGSGQ